MRFYYTLLTFLPFFLGSSLAFSEEPNSSAAQNIAKTIEEALKARKTVLRDFYPELYGFQSSEEFFFPSDWHRSQPSTRRLRPEYKKTFAQVLETLLGTCEYLFFADTHLVTEESLIPKNSGQLKRSGVRYVPVEFPKEFQNELAALVNSNGLENNLVYPWNRATVSDTRYVLQLAMNDSAFNIRAIDIESKDVLALDENSPADKRADRERSMAESLAALPREGKKLVVLGGGHSQLTEDPYPTPPFEPFSNGLDLPVPLPLRAWPPLWLSLQSWVRT